MRNAQLQQSNTGLCGERGVRQGVPAHIDPLSASLSVLMRQEKPYVHWRRSPRPDVTRVETHGLQIGEEWSSHETVFS